MTRFTAACIQLNVGPEIEPNLRDAAALVRRACDAGAALIATPENTGFIAQGREAVLQRALPEERHPGLPFFADLARETGATLLIGSLSIGLPDGKAANRSYLFAPSGEILARYDKIHMFDVELAGGERYRESSTFEPGDQAVVAPLPTGGVLGMTVCYDLRFAALYRILAQAGADILSIPSAFTRKTGQAHWHVLLQARAIETGSFVVAPAQTGTHDKGRQTYGHSLIVAPWGEILADAGEEVGIVTAEIDLARVAEARAAIPALRHDRRIALPQPTLCAAGD
jgi:predicted amidohydrolase